MFLADFHIHSEFSDGSMSIPEIVDFYGALGFGAIAITDHLCEEKTPLGKAAAYMGKTLTRDSFDQYQEILKHESQRAWNRYQMILIPGAEITKNSLFNHRAAHIVALGVTEWISADQDFKSIAREIKNKGGFAIAAHPLAPHPHRNKPYYLWEQRAELEDEFDAWEITYHSTLLQEVVTSNLTKIASSDLHRPDQIKSWKTALSCGRDQTMIFNAIRSQNVQFQFYNGNEGASTQPHHPDFQISKRPLKLEPLAQSL